MASASCRKKGLIGRDFHWGKTDGVGLATSKRDKKGKDEQKREKKCIPVFKGR